MPCKLQHLRLKNCVDRDQADMRLGCKASNNTIIICVMLSLILLLSAHINEGLRCIMSFYDAGKLQCVALEIWPMKL